MITTHQPYACPNVSQHPHWISVPETTWIRSWLGTPIVVHGEVVGLFSLDSDQIGFYTQKHAERIVPFAEQAAIAFTNARLYQQLNTLHQTARDILSQLELEDMLEQLAQTILDTTHTTSVTICDYDPEYHCGKVLLTCCIPNAPCADTLLERGTGITFTTPLLQQLLASHKRSRVLFPPELQVALPGINPVIHMMIVTPMFSDERMIGFMLIGESRAGYLHTADEIRMSEAITDLAAIALEKAMLFENIQRLERVKSDMIRMASHDIRSPLTRAQAVLEMLDNQLGAQVTPKQQNYFRILREATGQIQDITTNILSLKRIDEHHEQEKLINWRSLIDEVVHAVALDFEMRQQKLNVEYDSALPMTHGDPLRLSLALTNLLTNANKYSHTKSTVTIRALTRDYGDKPYLTIEVEDNGPGIPPENQKRLFQQYYRANMDPSIPGTGLGLSLVRFVIEEHQGSVYVSSDPGQGSIFGFRLPIR
jgi:signal transduction histidine kinase